MLLFSVFALEPRARQTETTGPICVYSGTVGQQSFVLFLIPFSFITVQTGQHCCRAYLSFCDMKEKEYDILFFLDEMEVHSRLLFSTKTLGWDNQTHDHLILS